MSYTDRFKKIKKGYSYISIKSENVSKFITTLTSIQDQIQDRKLINPSVFLELISMMSWVEVEEHKYYQKHIDDLTEQTISYFTNDKNKEEYYFHDADKGISFSLMVEGAISLTMLFNQKKLVPENRDEWVKILQNWIFDYLKDNQEKIGFKKIKYKSNILAGYIAILMGFSLCGGKLTHGKIDRAVDRILKKQRNPKKSKKQKPGK